MLKWLNLSISTLLLVNITSSTYLLVDLSLGQCIFAYKFVKRWDTIPECIQNASSAEIFKTHILTVSRDRCTHLQTFHDRYD